MRPLVIRHQAGLPDPIPPQTCSAGTAYAQHRRGTRPAQRPSGKIAPACAPGNGRSHSQPPPRQPPRSPAEKPERPGEVGRSEPMEADFTGGLPRTCRGPRNSGPAIPMHIPQRHFSAGLLVALASLGQPVGGRSVSLMPSACFSAKPWASRRPNRPRASPDAPYSRPRAFRMASSRGSITTASPAACMAARTSLSPLPVLRTTMRSSGCTLPCATALTRPA